MPEGSMGRYAKRNVDHRSEDASNQPPEDQNQIQRFEAVEVKDYQIVAAKNAQPAQSNTGQRRGETVVARAALYAMPPPPGRTPAGPPRRESQDGKTFYDTDAGSIDSSTTVSARPSTMDLLPGRAVTPTQLVPRAAKYSPIREERSSDYDEGDEAEAEGDEHEDELPDVDEPLHGGKVRLNERQQLLMAEMDRTRIYEPTPDHLPHLQGADSYPSTTTGIPSVLNPQDSNSRVPMLQPLRVQRSNKHNRPSSPTVFNQQRQSAPSDISDIPDDVFTSSRPKLHNATPPNFNSANLTTKSLYIGHPRLPPSNRNVPARQAVPASVSTNSAQPRSAPIVVSQSTAGERPLAPPQNQAPIEIEQQLYRQSTGSHRPLKDVHRQQQSEYYQEEPPLVKNQRRPTTPAHFSLREQDPQTGHQQEVPEEKTLLDHYPPQLYTLSYSVIKAADFDTDPQEEAFTIPGNKPNHSLEDKLQSFSELSRDDQAAFFGSLKIDEWEEAGDWFLERFSVAASRLKKARRAKRDLARQFEGEIEHRHNAVMKKRKQTDDALEEMRTNGGRVLQGTPKTAKKTK